MATVREAAPAHLADSSERLLERVSGMTTADWPGPSGLPRWNRRHVVAHLALNAEALIRVLQTAAAGDPAPMYPSQEERDERITKLAQAPHAEIVERLRNGVDGFAQAVSALPAEEREVRVERVPGGRRFRAGSAVLMRWREVEIHHADLNLGYTWRDFPEPFVRHLLDFRSRNFRQAGGFSAYATDLDAEWQFGMGGPYVSGPGGALAWWATGRDPGDVLTCDDGDLPAIDAM